jgi:ribonuclease BN (tRNA processing enzyme)
MTEIVFIGTSDAFGAGGRRQAAILVRAPQGSALLDCAGTTLTGLTALGIAREEIDAVLISHFHADHFAGIPQLLLAAHYEDGRRRPLRIAGPPGVERRVRDACAALGHPFEGRDWSFPIAFQELPAGAAAEVGPVRARSFEVRHAPDAVPHGLSVACGADRVVYTGDTGWFDALPAAAAGARLFICECTFLSRGIEHHLSYEEISERRGHFDCGRMILTHLGEEMAARRGACDIETADDGLSVRI